MSPVDTEELASLEEALDEVLDVVTVVVAVELLLEVAIIPPAPPCGTQAEFASGQLLPVEEDVGDASSLHAKREAPSARSAVDH